MKKILNYIITGGICLSIVACQKNFVNLNPPAAFTDAVYFKQPSDFKAYTASFYGYYDPILKKWIDGILPNWDFGNMDNNSDISANVNGAGFDIGHGTIAVGGGGGWGYSGIRSCNILLSKAASYTGTGDISQYAGEAYFFRAFAYYGLLKSFGGVPLVTTVLDVNAPELQAPRNSRYEVVKQILADLDAAISKLPAEQNIAATDKGRVSKWAAEAVKAQVELYEATWEKYVGQTTDGDGTTSGAGSKGYDAGNVNKYLADAVAMSLDVMNNGGYALWNQNATPSMANLSSWYLFNLEDAGSNPGGFDKTSNKEFILYSVYDNTYRQSGKNITWTVGQLYPSRKFVDLAVCTDGLPPEKSPLFQGYHHTGNEFKNRDLRMLNYLFASATAPTSITLDYGSLGYSGYANNKYAVYKYGPAPNGRRTDGTESANWPIIRLAEVYLTYAEAVYELNGNITDGQLNASINILRDRSNVAHLTNALVTGNGLDMKNEIRRERAVELYREGKRFDDLKRWGILEAALNPSRLGMVVGDGTTYATDFKDASGNPTALYKATNYVWGEEAVQTPAGILNCVVVDSKANHTVLKKHYLNPISQDQINLNNNLKQNPGY
jgi:hypothetical protein